MEDRDTLIRENARRKFTTLFGYFGEPISEMSIGPFETLYTLEDGRKVVYDDIDDVVTVYHKHDEEIDILPVNEWKKEFARKLKRAIRLSGMTQREFAEKTGISQGTMSNYIRGSVMPTAYNISLISKALKLAPDYLCNFDYLL